MKTTSLAILSWVCLILAGPRAWAIRPPAQEPLANFDKRTAAAAPAAGPAAAVAALQARLPKARVDFEIITGSPKMVSGTDGFLTGPDGHGGGVSAATAAQFAADDPHRATKAFLQEHRALFGHGPEVLQPARLLRQYVTPHNGLNTVVWEQQVDGIGVFEAVLISHTTRQGELVNLSSQFVPDPVAAAAQGTPNRAALLAAPGVSARQALALAGQNTGEQFRAEEAAAAGPVEAGLARRQKFTAPGLKGPAGTQLLWLPMDRDHLRLCWDVVLMSRRRGEMFRLLVDARTGEVLFRRCLTQYLTEATFRVYTNDSPSPFSPGFSTPQTNQPPVVPRSLVTLAALDTNASPAGWIPDGGNETLGNNVDAHTDRNNDDRPDLPRPHGAPSRVFDFPMDLATQDPTNYAAAAVVQLFYTCNWMHDRLYELGFTEAAGNFQTSNFGRGGLEDDAVLADAQDGSGTDNANFSTPPDGQPGRMQMYIFTGPRPRRDGDFDAEIVLHEYTHGLSGRLVGGGQGLGTLQSDGMGEGWSDFYGLALLSQPGDDVDGVYAAGAYASYRIGGSNDTENYYFGIRRYPYTTDLTKNPLTFKDIDPAQADYCASGAPYHTGMFGACSSSMANEVHNQGEVWCATLWEARAALVRKYGWALGNPMILQLVTDGMKLTPAQPNFLQARDAILQADRVNNGGANLAQLWAAFAKRGMGFSAESPASTTTTGVAESFDLPDDLLILPKTALSFSGPVAGPFQPTVQSYVLTNQGPNPVVWRATADQPWLNLAPATGTLAVGGPSVEVTVWLDRVAGEIPAGTFTNLIHFTNATTGVSQLRRVVLGCRDQDSLTELFSRDDFDLAYRTLTFSPDGSPQFYAVCSQPATQFPTDPSGGVLVSLGDDGSAAVTLSGGRSVMFYGVPTNTFYIGGNGYLTFDSGDWTYAETLASHFNQRRISAFFHDLYSDGSARVSWKQLGDRVAVTYQNIRDYNAWAWNNFQIELFFAGRIRITYLMMESQSGLVGLSRGQGVPAGFVESDFSSHTVCLPALTLALPASANEGAGVLVQAGRLAVPSPLATNLTVLLQSSDPSELLVPPAVLLPAGATSVTFDVTVLDDAAFDGGRRPYVVASAPGFLDGAASLLLYDNETAVLSVRLPSSVTEGDAPTQAVVQVSAAPATSVLVTLECSNPSELRVQPFAIIPAGQTSAVFSVEAVDDTWIDGDQRVTVSAQVPGWISGAASLVVHDNESTNLTVELPVAVTEGQGLRPGLGTVRFAGTVVSNVVVGLESSDSSELMVPASVTVFSGASWASFDLTVLDDAAADGPQTVQVTARAPGFQDGTTSLVVNDNEQPLPPFSPQPPNLASHVAAQVVLSWVSTDGDLLLNGGFETGDFTGWTRAFGGSGNFVINNGSYDPPGPEGPTPPFEGRFSALAQQTGPAVMQIFQDVHLPPEATFAQLAWRQRIHNYAASYDYDQGLWVDILTPQGSWLAEAFGTTSATPLSNDWTAQQFDLTPFLGQTVRIVFTVYNQDTNLNVHLDDIGVRLSSTTPSLYSVFFGTNAALGPAQLLGSTTNTLWPLPLLDPLTPYYWQVVAQRGLAVTGAVWQFTTRGPNHFDWSDIASPQYVNTPFTVSLTARDEFNRVVTNFTGPLDLAAVASQKTLLLFGDDFEDGDFDGWDVGSGAYARAVTDQTAATGEYSFTQLGGDGSHLNGVSHSLAGLRPDRVSFYVRAQTNNLAGGYFVLDDGSGAFGIAVFFFMSNDGQMGLYEDQDGWLAVPYDAGRWYKISLAFDWQNQAVDYLVDDQLRFAAIPFRNPVDALGTVYLYNFDSTQAWWDDIRFENPFLLGLSPTRATPITAGRWMGAATVLDPINAVHLTATDDLGHVSPSASFAVLLRDDAGLQAFGSPEVVAIGRPVTYTLLVTNTGPSSATGVWVTNLCPAAAEILSATASQGSFTQAGQAVLFNLGSLASGATATLTVRITPLAGGLLTNTAALARQETDLYAPNNIASVVTVVLPQLSLTDATVVEGNLGVTGAVFTVTLSAPLDRPVSFDYATADGTAQAGRDYLAQSGRLVLPPGVLSTQVIVAVLGDVRVEPDETFYLNLSHPVNVTLGRTQALGAILNDDGLPGEIAAVAWGAISSPQQVNHPFAVTLTALDAAGRLASNFNGTVALSAWQSVPETNLIGTRSSDASFPLGGGNQVQRTQVIYLAEELGAAGQIMSLALDVSSAPSLTTLSNWTIRLKHTSLSSCEFGTWEATDWTLVYQTNLSVSGAQTLTFTLPTPFNYNGADNLMVDFSFNHTTTASARYCWTTSQNSVRTLSREVDASSGDPLLWTGATPSPYGYWARPNLQFTLHRTAQVVPALTDRFQQGLWSGAVAVAEPGASLTLVANDLNGHSGVSAPVEVQLVDDVGLTMTDTPDPLAVGQNLTYTLTVTNTGPSWATGVMVTNWWPAGASFVSASASAGTFSLGGNQGAFLVGSLPPAASATLTLVVRPLVSGHLLNLATVFRQEADNYLPNNTAQVTTAVLPTASIQDVSVAEGNVGPTEAVFTVTLSGAYDQMAQVYYSTADGTATAGVDYVGTSGSLQFWPGTTSAVVVVPILGDVECEPDETFWIQLLAVTNVVVQTSPAMGTILNDDCLPGDLESLAWSAVASPQTVHEPFPVTLSARDAFNQLATNFTGSVVLTAWDGPVLTNTIGTDTAALDFPLDPYYPVERSQVIYLASELSGAGRIAALALDVGRVPGAVLNRWTIRLRHTSLSSYQSSVWESADWVVVYQTNQLVTSAGWVVFPLQTPFDYDGVENLMVDFSFNNSSSFTDAPCRGSYGGATRALYLGASSSGYGDPLGWSGSSPYPWSTAYRPNLRLWFGNPIRVEPELAGPFTGGTWTGFLSVPDLGAAVTLWADDQNGHQASVGPLQVVANNDLSVSLALSSSQAMLSQPFTYTLRVNNSGPAPATGVVLSNLCPDGVSFLSAVVSQGSWTETGGGVRCLLGTLAGGAQAMVDITVVPTVCGWITNLATVSRFEPDTYPGNNSARAVTLVTPPLDEFQIQALLASHSQVVDHQAITGDDRGGLAASTSQVFYSGDNSTARFALADLSGGTALGQVYDALVGDLRSGVVYSLGDGQMPLDTWGGTVTTLLEHDGATGGLNGSAVPLSAPISLPANGGDVGLFAGYGQILLHTGSRVYAIVLPTGTVLDLGAMRSPPHTYTESWAYWGVAEYFGGSHYLVCVQNSTTIARTAVPDGSTTTLASFSDLSDMASITLSVPLNRWYFHYEGHGQFGGADETLGYADAVFRIPVTAPPALLLQPTNQTAFAGAAAVFSVEASGGWPLAYQWRWNGLDLGGQTQSSLVLPDVRASQAGRYQVVVANSFGAVTSAVATLTVAQPAPPTITAQPQAQTVFDRGNAVLQVTATAQGPLNYQWYWGPSGVTSRPVAGATGPTLITPPLSGSASFWLRVTNAAGSADSVAVGVTALPPMSLNLHGMGDRLYGKLGDGWLGWEPTPEAVGSSVAQVAAGGSHSLFVKTDGTLWAMGYNGYGQLGDGTWSSRSAPVLVTDGVAQVAAGGFHSLFVKTDGTLWAMGNNGNGQLGDGTWSYRSAPVLVTDGVAQVAAGEYHSLFVKTDGTLWAMGNNGNGELGDGATANRNTPVLVAGGVAQAAAGYSHSLFVKTDGTLWGMGWNGYGQLGDGTTTARNAPVQVTSGVAQVMAGEYHSLWVKSDGTLWATGYNGNGQLGDGTWSSRTTPVRVADSVAQVAAGGQNSLFVGTDGVLRTMGANWQGQLGDGTTTAHNTPVAVANGVAQAAAGESHSLFVKTDGTLWAMGYNRDGQLGDGASAIRSTPFFIANGAAQMAVGIQHTLVVKSDGTLWAMGYNGDGQLGDGTWRPSAVPILVTNRVAQAAAGEAHSLLVKTDGTLWAMGNNGNGQLGDGTSANRGAPVLVASGVAQAAAGADHSLFLKTDATLWAMGANWAGQLGDGSATSQSTPVHVDDGVAQVAAGENHSLFVKTDGTLWAMGWNGNGQLGDGTTLNRNTPVQVANGVAQAVAGQYHSLFVKTDGTLWAMGYNGDGELGDGATGQHLTPVPTTNVVAQAAAGGYHSLFVKTDGALWGMGGNWTGQLGDGSTADHVTPFHLTNGVARVAAGYEQSLFLSFTDGKLAPIIVSQPQSRTNLLGTAATFTVRAMGFPEPTYQWRKESRALSGQTNATLQLADVQLTDVGAYSVVVGNTAGSITSAVAILGVSTSAPQSVAYANDHQIIIGDHALATPYPATIVVSGQTRTVRTVTVTLQGLTHTWPHDVGVLLTGPQGQNVVLMADAGGDQPVADLELTFDDAAPASLAEDDPLTSGAFRPSSCGGGDLFPAPAPAGPYGVALSVFQGSNPNGIWSLYVLDDSDSDSGRLGAGWSLSLVLEPPVTQPPQLTQQPVGQTNLVGRTVVFSAAATGTPPLFYRWRCNAAGLAEGGRYSGTDTPALFIANAQTNDTGGYTLVVSNAWGTVSSVVANLTVVSPVQPFIMPDSLGLFDNGQFQFVLSGAAGSTYMIEVSSDLRAWKALRTLRLTNSDSVFLDATTNLLRRFYRARLVP